MTTNPTAALLHLDQLVKRYGGVTWEMARLWIDDAIPTNGEVTVQELLYPDGLPAGARMVPCCTCADAAAGETGDTPPPTSEAA